MIQFSSFYQTPYTSPQLSTKTFKNWLVNQFFTEFGNVEAGVENCYISIEESKKNRSNLDAF